MAGRILGLAWPVVAEMLCLVTGGILTTAMVGRFGAVEVASVGLATLIQVTFAMVTAAAGTGAGALVSRAYGAGRIEDARNIAGQALVMGITGSIIAALFCFTVGRMLIAIASPDTAVVEMSSSFLSIMAFFLPFMAMINVCLASIRATGKTRVAMCVAIIGQVISLSVTYTCLFVFKIGVHGAIFGMSASQVVAAMVSFMAARHDLIFGLRFKNIFPLQKDIIRNVLKISLPAGFEQLAIQSGRIAFSLFMATTGAIQFAGHNVALQIESISFMPGMAFGIAAMTLVGQNLGKGLPHRAKEYAYITWAICAMLMGSIGIGFYVFAENLTSFFIQDPAVLSWGTACVRVAAIEQVFLATGMVLPGVLRGSGDTVSAMYVAILGSWVYRLPLIFFIKHFGYLTVEIGWFCACSDIAIRALLFIYIVRKKNWQDIKI